jgi:hypothetical protein
LLDLLYTDQVGGQRTINRFGLMPRDDGWISTSARHWYLDAPAALIEPRVAALGRQARSPRARRRRDTTPMSFSFHARISEPDRSVR